MKFIEKTLQHKLENKISVFGLTEETTSIYIKQLFTHKKDILVITNSLFEANQIYQSLLNYTENVYFFPVDDFLTEEAIAMSKDLQMTRVNTINKILEHKSNKIVVTHLLGGLRYLPSLEIWKDKILKINKKTTIKKENLLEKLYDIGYELNTVVTQTGEIANRGYILDVYPIDSKNAVRIEFWGDEIDSIRYFDVDTQLSLGEVDEILIFPVTEFITNQREAIKKQKYLNLYEKVSSILDYLEDPILIYKDINQLKNSYLKLKNDIFNYKVDKNEENLEYMHDFDKLKSSYEIYIMNIENIYSEKVNLELKYDFKKAFNYEGNLKKLNEDISAFIERNKIVILALSSTSQIKNAKNYIDESIVITDENNLYEGKVNIINKNINEGFVFDKYVILSEKNIFKNININKSYKNVLRYGSKITNINKLNVSDYVVHNIHGIGIYRGIVAIEKNGVKKDYLQIEYKDNGKLYIPVEKIELISKYSSNEGIVPKINKLGGTEWQKTKQRVRSRLQDIAQQLIETSAKRKALEGFAFSSDKIEQTEFESEFVYEETKDQLSTTRQIKEDMEKPYPMDRILCGDVGYGKTEVAFRAIFKAIMDNKQVAYLCPTTLLSNQQYQNALDRFKNYPINIALLNRFTPLKEKNRIIDGIKNKKIDIVFGTHRLLSKDVNFKDLGLLIIDEEQRFGVIHKEKIKEYKTNVDVLTLSATPIPRTLQMAMVGIKNLSLIETPPVDRYPIQTYVIEESDYIIKDAIYKEISRDGQVFILFNSVEKIQSKVEEIKRLIPDGSIVFIHGQMNKTEIEEKMFDFINRKYNILICTTIIETGIDIPNVNTLIVLDADKFGLSQLYQIRGRVGRTNKIAYAYLMYKKNKVLNEIAIKRLSAIKEFTELGSGFSIAVRDLSIRGSGDILGSEQSGFIDTIGIELYTKMLNDEVNRIKGITINPPETENEQPLINIETHIEDSYVDIDELKIEIHKKINEIDTQEKLLNTKKEIEDRFGTISEPVLLYMYQELFEKIAREKGIERVIQNKNSTEFIFSLKSTNSININSIYQNAYNIGRMFRFSYINRQLKVILDTIKLDKHWLYYILDFLNNI